MRAAVRSALLLVALAACGGGTGGSDDDDDTATDAAATDVAATDAATDATASDGADDATALIDASAIDAAMFDAQVIDGAVIDAAMIDAQSIDARPIDAQSIDAQPIDAAMIDAPTGPITGGPCLSGAPGQTAYRVRWAGSGGTAYVQYEVHAMPDTSRFRAGAYGYQIGFTPQYVDTALAQGGLLLNSSDFVDIELSTVGISSISSAHLALYGRSYSVSTSGSFNWQTFDGLGQTASNVMSNGTPYAWDSGDMTTEISPGDDGVRIRIKAGPSSGSLVVNRIEICLQAS
jgi:hypothetical protein